MPNTPAHHADPFNPPLVRRPLCPRCTATCRGDSLDDPGRLIYERLGDLQIRYVCDHPDCRYDEHWIRDAVDAPAKLEQLDATRVSIDSLHTPSVDNRMASPLDIAKCRASKPKSSPPPSRSPDRPARTEAKEVVVSAAENAAKRHGFSNATEYNRWIACFKPDKDEFRKAGCPTPTQWRHRLLQHESSKLSQEPARSQAGSDKPSKDHLSDAAREIIDPGRYKALDAENKRLAAENAELVARCDKLTQRCDDLQRRLDGEVAVQFSGEIESTGNGSIRITMIECEGGIDALNAAINAASNMNRTGRTDAVV